MYIHMPCQYSATCSFALLTNLYVTMFPKYFMYLQNDLMAIQSLTACIKQAMICHLIYTYLTMIMIKIYTERLTLILCIPTRKNMPFPTIRRGEQLLIPPFQCIGIFHTRNNTVYVWNFVYCRKVSTHQRFTYLEIHKTHSSSLSLVSKSRRLHNVLHENSLRVICAFVKLWKLSQIFILITKNTNHQKCNKFGCAKHVWKLRHMKLKITDWTC